MRILIIEDEKIATDRLERLLLDIEPNASILAKIDSVQRSVEWLSTNTADLIFMDIQLSDGVSFSIFEQIKLDTPVIFTTAYDEYALKAFRVNSVSYLLKPINQDDLKAGIEKFKKIHWAPDDSIRQLIASLYDKRDLYRESFVLQIGDKIIRIEPAEIAYFYASEKSVFLRTFQNKSYPIECSLDSLEDQLDPKKFFRINRKMIIHLRSIQSMTAFSRARVKLKLSPSPDCEDDALVSTARSSDFRKWLE